MVESASWVPRLGIPGLAALMTLLFLWGARRVNKGKVFGVALGVTLLWWAVSGGLAVSGALGKFDSMPPPMAPFMAACLAVGVAIGFSAVGTAFRDHAPMAALILFQGFRFPLELVMHQAASEGVMPPPLSYSGYNFDVVIGLSGLILGTLGLSRELPRAWVWAWNLGGWVTLTVILIIAIATSPMVKAFGSDPRMVNTWVTHVPYVWLPAILVALAVGGHIIVTRKLLQSR